MELKMIVGKPENRAIRDRLQQFLPKRGQKLKEQIPTSCRVPVLLGDLELSVPFLLYLSEFALAPQSGRLDKPKRISLEAIQVAYIALRLLPYNFFMTVLATIREGVENLRVGPDFAFTQELRQSKKDRELLRSLLLRLGPPGLNFVQLREAFDLRFDRGDREFTKRKWQKVVDESLRVRKRRGRPAKEVYDQAYEMRKEGSTYGQIARKLLPGVLGGELEKLKKQIHVAVLYRQKSRTAKTKSSGTLQGPQERPI